MGRPGEFAAAVVATLAKEDAVEEGAVVGIGWEGDADAAPKFRDAERMDRRARTRSKGYVVPIRGHEVSLLSCDLQCQD